MAPFMFIPILYRAGDGGSRILDVLLLTYLILLYVVIVYTLYTLFIFSVLTLVPTIFLPCNEG